MLFLKLITLAAVLAPALGILWLQHHSVTRQEESNSRVRVSITAIEQAIDTLEKSQPDVRPLASGGKVAAPAQIPHAPAAPGAVSKVQAASIQNQIPYVTLSKTNLRHLELASLTADFKLTDEACAVLGISPAERAALDQAVTKLVTTQQQMDIARIESINEHLTTEDGRKTTFKVPAYAEEGRKLAEGLIAETQGAIGTERAELLLGYADLNSLSAAGYEPFGRTEKTITFLDRENPDGTRGDCKIWMKITDTTSGLTLSTSFDNRDDSIPKAWQHLIENTAPAQ